MPKFRVLEKSYINNGIREEGEIIDYPPLGLDPEVAATFKAGANLEPVDTAGETLQAPKGVSTEDMARQKVAAAAGDPSAVDTTTVISAAADAAAKVVASTQLAPAAAGADLV